MSRKTNGGAPCRPSGRSGLLNTGTLNGGHEWHEVKGWMDQKSAVRLKRMSQNYPDEVVRVIDGRWFAAAIKGGLAALIPNWEKQGT